MKMKKIRHQWKKTGCILLAAGMIGSSSLSVNAADIGETEVSYTEAQVEPQTDYRENSWRYDDGERIGSGILRTEEDEEYENAWTYENGHYVNSAGEPIEGALAKGVDVSTFNGEIDWETVKNETDIDYAIIRCGYGNDFEDQDDAQWERNASECTRVGMPFGVYIYSYALDTEEALSEAEHVLRLVEGYNLDLPIYLDLEDEKYTGSLSNEEIADIAEVFCDKIEEAGYEVGIYANLYWFNNKLTDPRFDRWEKWIAQYNEQCDYEGEYGMWQFELVEPVRILFKDEVRVVGDRLGLPHGMVYRQPFPGPGLGVRCPGAITRDRLEAVRESDAILIEEFEKNGLVDKVWQYFTVVPDFRSTGIKNDKRAFEWCCIVRAVNTTDVMTATVANLPYELMCHITDRITHEVPGINRVLYDFTPKPTGTVEFE